MTRMHTAANKYEHPVACRIKLSADTIASSFGKVVSGDHQIVLRVQQ